MRQYVRDLRVVILTLLMIIGSMVAYGKDVYAASATIKLATVSENIQEGDTFSVTMTITSSSAIGEVSTMVKYDTNALEFKTENSIYEASEGIVTITDSTTSESKTKKYVLEFKALKTGSTNIKLQGTPTVYASDGSILSISKNGLTVEVEEQRELSNNKNLSALSVKEGTLNETFQKSVTEYTMNVSQDVTKVTVSATAEDQNATVSITGADKLLVGENTVTITVTSEKKKTKDYVITVTRGTVSSSQSEQSGEEKGQDLPQGSEMPQDGTMPQGSEMPQGSAMPETSEMPQETAQPDVSAEPTASATAQAESNDKVTVETVDGTTLYTGEHTYELLTVSDQKEVPTGYVSAELTIAGQAVEAYQKEDPVDSNIYLIYAKYGENDPAFYYYDAKEQTIQRYIASNSSTNTPEQTVTAKSYNSMVQTFSIVIGVLAGVIILLLLRLARRIGKKNGYDRYFD